MPTDDAVTYELEGSVATLTIDDGKANVMSMALMEGVRTALDRAEEDGAVVLLTGRDGMFSGGFDLALFDRSAEEVVATLRTGGDLVHRVLGFPRPVVVACTGHAIAQGAFVVLAADVRLGAAGDFRLGLNEVAIGLTIPYYGIEAARQRLTPAWFNHATTTGTLYDPDAAAAAGFLDHVVPPAELGARARAEAERLTAIDFEAHRGTKLRTREGALRAMRSGIDAEFPE